MIKSQGGLNPASIIRIRKKTKTRRKLKRRWPKLLTPAQKIKQKAELALYRKKEKDKDRAFNQLLTSFQKYAEMCKIDFKLKKYW